MRYHMPETGSDPSQGQLLAELPPIFQQQLPFLGAYLLAFEAILLGRDDSGFAEIIGLEAQIDNLATYFDPQAAPDAFLPWLAQWVALSLRADLDPPRLRRAIAWAVPLYRRRGCWSSLRQWIEIFSEMTPAIREFLGGAVVGVQSTVGEDFQLGGVGRPFYFEVTVARHNRLTPVQLARERALLEAVIDLEKPAHTEYKLIFEFPTLQIFDDTRTARLGVDTIITDETTVEEETDE